MTRELLEGYRSKTEEIKELQCKLQHLYEGDSMIGNDTILDYTKGYPVPHAVVGVDWDKAYKTQLRYEKKIEILSNECKEVEEFIESIQDSVTRRIFRMYYIDGMSQRKISSIMHMDRSNVSKKIDAFLKVSHNSHNSHL